MRAIKILAGIVSLLCLVLLIKVSVTYIRNIDTLPPVIDMDSPEITVSISDPVTQVMSGVKATDSKDGDVTSLMAIKDISDFDENNRRRVGFIAFDKDGNYSEAQRMLSYSDYEPIKLEIKKSLRFPVGASEEDILGSFSAWDCLDGDLSESVRFSADSIVNTNTPARYKAEVDISNSAGETAVLPVTIEIYNPMLETTLPQISLDKYLIYTPIEEKISVLDHIKSVRYRGTDYGITSEEGTFGIDTTDWGRYEKEAFKKRDPAVNKDKFNVTSYVNYQVPGTYDIVCELTDLDGNTGSVILTVVVEEENSLIPTGKPVGLYSNPE